MNEFEEFMNFETDDEFETDYDDPDYHFDELEPEDTLEINNAETEEPAVVQELPQDNTDEAAVVQELSQDNTDEAALVQELSQEGKKSFKPKKTQKFTKFNVHLCFSKAKKLF